MGLGTSLNEELYAGPKLQNGLFDVLLRSCRFPVAVACDVSALYLQIRIPIEDCSKFRFLWRNLEVERKPDIYEFERVVFGDAHSTCLTKTQEFTRKSFLMHPPQSASLPIWMTH